MRRPHCGFKRQGIHDDPYALRAELLLKVAKALRHVAG